jgi:hypothetical protein
MTDGLDEAVWPNRGSVPAIVWRNCGKLHETPVKVVDVLTQIRTEGLPNTSLERYFYTN